MLLQEKHKISTSVINYLTKDISYAISQNKGNPKGLEKTLNSIIPHSFGDHELCDASWCHYHENPSNYRHSSLPYGKDLVGTNLKEDLTKLFSSYAKNSEKLSTLGSSQGNESLNYMISMKAPKAKHFGGSQSLSYRVSSGVSQKNEGRSYIMEVNKNHNLSPGKYTMQQRLRMDKKRRLEREKETSRGAKMRRLGKKGKKMKKEKAKETREGKTYSTGVSSSDDVDIGNIELIPAPLQDIESTHLILDKQTNSVYFDLETTGFGTNCDIIQIAAIKDDRNSVFCKYFCPIQKITPSASKVTGFTKHGNVLYRNGEIMVTDEKKESLEQFISWLPENCMLFAHNAKSFDSRLLIKALEENDCISDFKIKCKGFTDTLTLFRDLLPERKENGKRYNQESLVGDVLNITYDAHNAIGDVESLKQLVDHFNISKQNLIANSFSIQYIQDCMKDNLQFDDRMSSFSAIPSSVISKSMVRKMAKSGLQMIHLQTAFIRDGKDGVSAVLSELFNGRPRVTKDKKILSSLSLYIESLYKTDRS